MRKELPEKVKVKEDWSQIIPDNLQLNKSPPSHFILLWSKAR